MKTLKMKIRNILKSKIKDILFNCSRVKADILKEELKVKEKNKVYETQTKYEKILPNIFKFFNLKDFIFL